MNLTELIISPLLDNKVIAEADKCTAFRWNRAYLIADCGSSPKSVVATASGSASFRVFSATATTMEAAQRFSRQVRFLPDIAFSAPSDLIMLEELQVLMQRLPDAVKPQWTESWAAVRGTTRVVFGNQDVLVQFTMDASRLNALITWHDDALIVDVSKRATEPDREGWRCSFTSEEELREQVRSLGRYVVINWPALGGR